MNRPLKTINLYISFISAFLLIETIVPTPRAGRSTLPSRRYSGQSIKQPKVQALIQPPHNKTYSEVKYKEISGPMDYNSVLKNPESFGNPNTDRVINVLIIQAYQNKALPQEIKKELIKLKIKWPSMSLEEQKKTSHFIFQLLQEAKGPDHEEISANNRQGLIDNLLQMALSIYEGYSLTKETTDPSFNKKSLTARILTTTKRLSLLSNGGLGLVNLVKGLKTELGGNKELYKPYVPGKIISSVNTGLGVLANSCHIADSINEICGAGTTLRPSSLPGFIISKLTGCFIPEPNANKIAAGVDILTTAPQIFGGIKELAALVLSPSTRKSGQKKVKLNPNPTIFEIPNREDI